MRKQIDEPRTARGGSRVGIARWARSAYRYARVPGNRHPSQGFRLCFIKKRENKQ